MILLIDALDSFTYNLVQAFQMIGSEVDVVRFDAIDLAGIQARAPDAIVLSPGPGRPEDCAPHMQVAASDITTPVLGVCLGQQALVAGAGGKVTHAREPLHGERTPVTHEGNGLFAGLPQPMQVGRYHSLIAEPTTLPACWRATAHTDAGEIMAVEHLQLPRWGVQFHPESILTPDGPQLLRNFLRLSGIHA